MKFPEDIWKFIKKVMTHRVVIYADWNSWSCAGGPDKRYDHKTKEYYSPNYKPGTRHGRTIEYNTYAGDIYGFTLPLNMYKKLSQDVFAQEIRFNFHKLCDEKAYLILCYFDHRDYNYAWGDLVLIFDEAVAEKDLDVQICFIREIEYLNEDLSKPQLVYRPAQVLLGEE